MEIVLSACVLKEIDRRTVEEYGIPGIILMENAAERMFQVLAERFSPCAVAVLAGKGNNGGDALVLTRKLFQAGFDVFLYILANSEEELSYESQINFKILKKLDIPFQFMNSENYRLYLERILTYPLLVDGMTGIGVAGALKGLTRDVVDLLNAQYQGVVVAVDVPTGLGTDEEYYEPVLSAALTLSVQCYKPHMLDYPGKGCCGEIIPVKIGFPAQLLENARFHGFLLERKDIRKPARSRDSHKGSYGRVLILCGSENYSGAPALALESALKSGVGYVYYAGFWQELLRGKYSEVIFVREEDCSWKDYDCILAGPGWGVAPNRQEMLDRLLDEYEGKLVLDADALTLLSTSPLLRQKLKHKKQVLLTPHLGEGARFFGVEPQELKKNKIKYLRQFQQEYPQATLLLKDSVSLLAASGDIFYLPWGSDFLARAGSGDLLSGLLCGFAAYQDLAQAAKLAVYLNGRAAELAADEKGVIGYDHSLLVGYYGQAFQELT